MERLFKKKYFIFYILTAGLVLRLISINQSLWLDEAIGALAARDFSYYEIINEFLKFDNHPPLYYLALKLWTSIFKYSEFSLRSMSVIFGLGVIFITYKIALLIDNKNKNFSIVATLLIATSQFHIYYSQEARMYQMAAFFASLSIYAFLLIEKRSKKLKTTPFYYWIFYSLSISAMLFTDYVPVFLIPVFWFWGLYKRKGISWWKWFILAHIPTVLFGLLWMPTFLVQTEKGRWLVATLPAWKQVAGGASLKQAILVWIKFVFGRISFINKPIYYMVVMFFSIPFLIPFIKILRKRKIDMVFLWLFLPLALGFFASFWFPAFIYFRFVYVVPAFCLLISQGLNMFKKNIFRLLTLIIVIFNLISCTIYILDNNQQRENWRSATYFVEENIKPDEIVLFDNPEPFAPYRWYSENGSAYGATDSISLNKEKTTQKLKKLTNNKRSVYHFKYLSELADPKSFVDETLKKQGFEKKDVFNFSGVGFIDYWTR